MRSLYVVLLTLGLGLQASQARGDLTGDVNAIQIWSRPRGNYSDDQNPSRGTVISVDPSRLVRTLETRTLFDVQYGRRVTYRGVALGRLAKNKMGEGYDRVLLHFANGMQIPVATADLGTLNAFLALEACDDKGKNCAMDFPTAARTDVYVIDEDPNPITFSWNKLVVGKAWHPVARRVIGGGFSPWRHADTLTGLEFVDGAAYDRQFAVGTTGGEQVFFQRCQFCHSARHAGASFGWDFVEPMALYEKRKPADLLNHVKYPKAMAQRLGIQMPPQKDVEQGEIKLLWEWMRDVSHKRLKPYQP